MYATALRSEGSARSGSGGVRYAQTPGYRMRSRWDQAKAASASFSASGIRSSPEMSFGRRVSRSSEQACHGMGTLNSWSMKTLGTKPLSLRLKRLGTFSSRCFESTQISLTSAKMTLA